MIELTAIGERQEDKERSMLKDLLHQLQKWREEEDEARGLIEDRVLGEYVDSFEKELGHPHHIMDKMWQMMQNRDTKTLNLDFDEVKQAGFWAGRAVAPENRAGSRTHWVRRQHFELRLGQAKGGSVRVGRLGQGVVQGEFSQARRPPSHSHQVCHNSC